jgi:predicted regulator of Ras-like GTPase activity (Roadblock/LC7/MglB family)
MAYLSGYYSRSHKRGKTMYSEAYSTALKNALTEIKNICPDVQTSFLFNKEGTMIAGDNAAQEAPLEKTVGAMEGIFEKTESIGGLDTVVINGQKGKVHISCVNDIYLAMVTSRNADMTYVQTVQRVLMPTVIKLLDSISTTQTKVLSSKPSPVDPSTNLSNRFKQNKVEDTPEEMTNEPEERTNEDGVEEEQAEPQELEMPSARELPEPSNQFIVDTLGGLLVRGDTVQVDAETLSQWSEYYDGAEINQVEIESFNGTSTTCKVKPIKDTKMEGKGIIRIPERACQDLEVKKGELVKVKPVVSEE